jgi:hypothetical protein
MPSLFACLLGPTASSGSVAAGPFVARIAADAISNGSASAGVTGGARHWNPDGRSVPTRAGRSFLFLTLC